MRAGEKYKTEFGVKFTIKYLEVQIGCVDSFNHPINNFAISILLEKGNKLSDISIGDKILVDV